MTFAEWQKVFAYWGGYAVICGALLWLIRELALKVIETIKDDTKAKIDQTAAMAKLSEKIDAWTRRKDT